MISVHSDVLLLTRFVKQVFPSVNTELNHWKKQAMQSEEILAIQALSSIRLKRFHAQGGSIYALYPGIDRKKLTPFIVAYQTISDYLDNLCDRAGLQDEQAFRQLHLAMEEALCPGAPLSEYYRYYPYKEDGEYLSKLVRTCQRCISFLPGWNQVQERVLEWARLYSNLQTYKHLHPDIREEKMKNWIKPYLRTYPDVSIWEFGAATGSTLGIFVLGAMATDTNLSAEDIDQVSQAYFPWICGLHILLDYFIDKEEDMETGDLNFVSYYENENQCLERLNWFVQQSMQGAARLKHSHFHMTIIRGLLAMYLSDPKATEGSTGAISRQLIQTGGTRTKWMHRWCQLLRKVQIL